MKHYLIAVVLCLSFVGIQAQNKTIDYGEKLVYSASYNMSGLLTDIAQVTMETSKVQTSKSTLMRLKCAATTYSNFDSFFKIRDLYESYVNPKTMTPYLYKRDINEGGYKKFMQYTFNPKSNTVKSLKSKPRKDGTNWEVKKTLKVSPKTKDLVTLLYYLRTLDIHKASPGDQQNFTVLFDNVENTVAITYIGKETIPTKIGSKQCYKLAISLKNNDVLKGADNNLIWLTADANKIPVYAKFKIPVGNGELKIVSASGLKH